MTIGLTQSNIVTNSLAATYLDYSSNVASGSLLVCAVVDATWADTLTCADSLNAGNWASAVSRNYTTLSHKIQIFYKYNSGAGACRVTVSGITGGTNRSIWIAEYSGIQTSSDPIDGTASAATASEGTPTQINSGAINTTATGLVVGLASYHVTGTPANTGTNYTNRGVMTAGYEAEVEDNQSASAGANNVIWAAAATKAYWAAIGAAFKAGVAGATATTLNGPSSGAVNAASTNFNVGVDTTPITGTLRVTPATDVSSGGSFSPTYLDLTTGSPSGTFTFTPSKSGVHHISITDDGGLTDPPAVTYTVAPAVTVTLQVATNDTTPAASYTGLEWAWWDAVKPSVLGSPTDKGATETTDGSGVITIPLPNSTKTNGQIGWLIVSNTDGTLTQSPPHKVFCGPAAVT